MELKQMRYFMVLAEEHHFGRAAERLHITQPPLTRCIQALENELDTPLFTRVGKRTTLTVAGMALLDRVRTILALSSDAGEQVRLAGRGYIGQLDVGIFSSGIFNVIPQMLGAFHAQRPQVKIGLHSMGKAEQIAALRTKRICIGFNRLVPREPYIAVEWVRREPYIVALYENHPLCDKPLITLADLDGEPMILYPNSPMHGLIQVIASAFRAEGVRLFIEQAVDDVMTAVALAASGFGVSITTESASNLRLPGVVYRPLHSLELQDIELNCLYRKDDDSPILAEFLTLMRSLRRTM
ncbi:MULTISPECIES: LysR family transcriptional regulator [Enterobacteriaceae]|uniref:LysR family transcriptional regulator n=1 Tax=Enterobacteriaceae TaxID=543 RepID=UPI000E2CD07D|nr:LysR family transcriptional regulator [Klebsiella pneumoniae]SWE94053.1 LysR family transcriptional regulator YnfL [Klebsiella pneumoniae]